MYIIQEYLSDKTWCDRYKNSDYPFIIEMYNNFCERYPNSKFRLIEVFIYV